MKLPSVVSFTQKFFVSRRRRVSIKVLYPEMSRIFGIHVFIQILSLHWGLKRLVERNVLEEFTTQLFRKTNGSLNWFLKRLVERNGFSYKTLFEGIHLHNYFDGNQMRVVFIMKI